MVKEVLWAHQVSTPFICVASADPDSTMRKIVEAVVHFRENRPASSKIPADTPIAVWDGLRAVTSYEGTGPLSNHNAGWRKTTEQYFPQAVSEFANPASAILKMAADVPTRSILFMLNLHRHMGLMNPMDPNDVVQAIQISRRRLRPQGKSVILISPTFPQFPPEISELTVIDDPLPTPEEIKELVNGKYQDLQKNLERLNRPLAPELDDEKMWHVVAACRGLPFLAVERALSLSLTETGVDVDRLWERKMDWVKDVAGIEVFRAGSHKLDDLGGLDQLKKEMLSLKRSRRRVGFVVQIPELDKQTMAVGGGDNTGITDRILADLLEYMENNQVRGYRLQGPPGTGKTHLSRAIGSELGVPFLIVRLGGLLNKYVGESEARSALLVKVLSALGENPVFIGDSNRDANIPPEMDRRFSSEGRYYVDLPTAEEKKEIWRKQLKAHGLKKQKLPDDSRWSGADIRNCCRKASDRDISVVEAAGLGMVPTGVSRAAEIDAMRASARGCWCSAARPGLYEGPTDGASGPDLELDDGCLLDIPSNMKEVGSA